MYTPISSRSKSIVVVLLITLSIVVFHSVLGNFDLLSLAKDLKSTTDQANQANKRPKFANHGDISFEYNGTDQPSTQLQADYWQSWELMQIDLTEGCRIYNDASQWQIVQTGNDIRQSHLLFFYQIQSQTFCVNYLSGILHS
jgi:hypothetical protein